MVSWTHPEKAVSRLNSDALVTQLPSNSRIVLGGMMAIDMGGPFNKAAYVFGTAAIAAGNYDIMVAVMYLVALVVGTVISAILLGLLKKKAA